MKNCINHADWDELQRVLMKMEIPYHVSFDSHVSEGFDTITYDTYIRIEPIVVQTEVKV